MKLPNVMMAVQTTAGNTGHAINAASRILILLQLTLTTDGEHHILHSKDRTNPYRICNLPGQCNMALRRALHNFDCYSDSFDNNITNNLSHADSRCFHASPPPRQTLCSHKSSPHTRQRALHKHGLCRRSGKQRKQSMLVLPRPVAHDDSDHPNHNHDHWHQCRNFNRRLRISVCYVHGDRCGNGDEYSDTAVDCGDAGGAENIFSDFEHYERVI